MTHMIHDKFDHFRFYIDENYHTWKGFNFNPAFDEVLVPYLSNLETKEMKKIVLDSREPSLAPPSWLFRFYKEYYYDVVRLQSEQNPGLS